MYFDEEANRLQFGNHVTTVHSWKDGSSALLLDHKIKSINTCSMLSEKRGTRKWEGEKGSVGAAEKLFKGSQ
jgi:hypothetical protein